MCEQGLNQISKNKEHYEPTGGNKFFKQERE